MSDTIIGWIFNVVSLAILVVTIIYLSISNYLLRKQREMILKDSYIRSFNELDKILMENPEFTDLWLNKEKIDHLNAYMKASKFDDAEKKDFLKKRAFASYIINNYYLGYLLKPFKMKFGEILDQKTDMPELRKMWIDAKVSQDFKDENFKQKVNQHIGIKNNDIFAFKNNEV